MNSNKPFLYYSTFCKHCQGMIQSVSTTALKDHFHYINIDNRYVTNNGVFIQLKEKYTIPLPSCIKRVPSLLFLKDNKVMVGNDIKDYIFEKMREMNQLSIGINGEPSAFAFNGHSCRFVRSDFYSFLDQDSSEMSAKGGGGLRQMYNYARYDLLDKIDTPVDENLESSGKLKSMDLEGLQKQRADELRSSVAPPPSILPR